jgi:hypothetical protein
VRNLQTQVLQIVLAGTGNFDNLRRRSDEGCQTNQSSRAVPFLQRNCFVDRMPAAAKRPLFHEDDCVYRNPLLQ